MQCKLGRVSSIPRKDVGRCKTYLDGPGGRGAGEAEGGIEEERSEGSVSERLN